MLKKQTLTELLSNQCLDFHKQNLILTIQNEYINNQVPQCQKEKNDEITELRGDSDILKTNDIKPNQCILVKKIQDGRISQLLDIHALFFAQRDTQEDSDEDLS